MSVLWPADRRPVVFVFHHSALSMERGSNAYKATSASFCFQNAKEDRRGEGDRTNTKRTSTRVRWRHGNENWQISESGIWPLSYLVPAKVQHGHGF